MERLRRLAGAPLLSASAASGSAFTAEDPEGSVAGWLREPLQADGETGALTPASVATLEAARTAAAAQRDHRSAAALDDFLRVLGPAAAEHPLDYYAPRGLEEQVRCFEEHGFCIIPEMVSGSSLERLQAAWLRLEAAAHEQWAASGAPERVATDYANNFNSQTFGVPFLSQEPGLMLELLDHPSALPLLARVCGEDADAVVETDGPLRGMGGMRAAGGSVSSLVPDPPGTCGYITCEYSCNHPPPRSCAPPLAVSPFQ
jgi:hypothetical protein